MKITAKNILITGGGSGIGFQIAKLLSEKGNTIIITGRNEVKLQTTAATLTNTSYIVADITKPGDIENLVDTVTNKCGSLNLLINNAGSANTYKLGENVDAYEKAAFEMETNYLAVVRLTEKLLPLLGKPAEAAIVNVTSIVAFAPGVNLPTYSATKAALHAYSRILRFTLARKTNIKVFELMPPLVNTELSAAIGGANGIPPLQVAEELLEGLESDTYEIHVGITADIYKLYLSSPEEALKTLNVGR